MTRKWYKKAYKEKPEIFKKWHQKYYKGNSKKIINASKKYRNSLRMEALKFYSGKNPRCACCGENNMVFLTFDHINGDGKKDRKKFKHSQDFVLELVKNKKKHKKRIQVLCYNCNIAKYRLGICPHKKGVCKK